MVATSVVFGPSRTWASDGVRPREGGARPFDVEILPGGEFARRRLDHFAVYHQVVQHSNTVTAEDAQLYAPALVVNEAFLGALGVDGLTAPVTVSLGGDEPVTATVVGVVAVASMLLTFPAMRSTAGQSCQSSMR